VVAEAGTWLRTPYHHRARVKGAGVDCAQILIGVYGAVGLVEPFDTGDYPMDWMNHRDEERYLGWIERFGWRVEAPKPGDIAVWRFGRTFSHGAVVVEWPRIIHANRRDGMVSYGDASSGDLAQREVLFYSLIKD
jgi:cell wall-associated NlpC family hydrolase